MPEALKKLLDNDKTCPKCHDPKYLHVRTAPAPPGSASRPNCRQPGCECEEVFEDGSEA